MASFTILILSLLLFLNEESSGMPTDYTTQGYFWRDYISGVIPIDALVSGSDYNGKPVYIGQVLFEGKLIPAKIYESDPKAYFSWGVEKSQTENVKIFCTQQPHRMEWIPTKHDEISLLTNRHLIIGGYDPAVTTYIGRVQHDGETLVGKIKYISDNANNTSMIVTKGGKGFYYNAYEILSYNPYPQVVDVPHNESVIQTESD